MKLKWFFCNEPTPFYSETPAFKTKSSWNPPKGHRCLEVSLSQVKKEFFEFVVSEFVDKGSYTVVWDKNDYMVEAEKQLGNKNTYKGFNFRDEILEDLVDKSNKMFRRLKSQDKITERNSNILHINIKKLLIR